MPSFLEAATRYRPDEIRILFIAESPPAFKDEQKKSYFYFAPNPGNDILFGTIVEALYQADYRKASGRKTELLQRLRDDGYWLMDAVETPINRIAGRVVKPKERAEFIRQNLPDLLDRLAALKQEGAISDSTGIILIKKIVFETLAEDLQSAGYRVLHSQKIDFPKYHRDRDTIAGIRGALAAIG